MAKANFKVASSPVIHEFMRYVLVGGLAFLVDFLVLYVLKEFILADHPKALYLATGLGFIAGLTCNYLLCLVFVFKNAQGTSVGRSRRDMTVFTIIGIIGLVMTEVGMYVGVDLVGMNYLFIKCVITGIVLIWNYVARKILVFS